MTYCVAMNVDEGLVGLADSLTSGLRSVRDKALTYLEEALAADHDTPLELLYPEGNWVDTGSLTPYHIIGSMGYGKPILDRVLKSGDSMRHAFKVACLSFDSTRISAADVDFPIDVVLYRRGAFRIVERRFEKHDLERLSQWWDARVRRAIEETPGEWFDRAYDEIYEASREKPTAPAP